MRPSCGTRFSARDDRELQALGRCVHLEQHAVDPVAHPETPFQRLQVDIRGPPADGLGDERVHQLDDRGVPVARLPLLPARAHGGNCGGRSRVRRHIEVGHFLTIMTRNGLPDVTGRGQRGLHDRAGHVGQAVDDIDGYGVGHGDAQHPALAGKGQDIVLDHERARQRRENRGRNRPLRQHDPRHAKLVRHGATKRLLVESGVGRQDIQHAWCNGRQIGVPGGPLLGRRQLLRRNQAPLEGDLDGVVVGGGHGKVNRTRRSGLSG
jgi:hypothetical protein